MRYETHQVLLFPILRRIARTMTRAVHDHAAILGIQKKGTLPMERSANQSLLEKDSTSSRKVRVTSQ